MPTWCVCKERRWGASGSRRPGRRSGQQPSPCATSPPCSPSARRPHDATHGGGMAIVHVIQENVLGCQTVAFDEHAIKRMDERAGQPRTGRLRATSSGIGSVPDPQPGSMLSSSTTRGRSWCFPCGRLEMVGSTKFGREDRGMRRSRSFVWKLPLMKSRACGGRLPARAIRGRQGDQEISDGVVYADYDAAGMLLGVEMLGPCATEVLGGVADKEAPSPVRGPS